MLFCLYQDSTKPQGTHFSDEYTQRSFKIVIPNIFKILQIINQDVFFNASLSISHINYILSLVVIKEISPGSFLSLTSSAYKINSWRFLIVIKIMTVLLHFLSPFFLSLSHLPLLPNLADKGLSKCRLWIINAAQATNSAHAASAQLILKGCTKSLNAGCPL